MWYMPTQAPTSVRTGREHLLEAVVDHAAQHGFSDLSLRQLAAGQLPPVPVSLPGELRQILEHLAQAIQEAQGGGTP